MRGLRLARFVFIALGAVAGALTFVLLAGEASAATGGVAVTSSTVAVGQEGSVEVLALNVTAPGLGAWTIDISYDPSIVTAVACTAGGGGVCNVSFGLNTIRVTGANASGLLGDTTLATITFRCEASGTSALLPAGTVFADATIGDPQDIDVTSQPGSITCTAVTEGPPPPGPPPGPPGGISCANFAYQEEAQAHLHADPTAVQLDPDDDGIACEELPARPWQPGGVYQGTVAGGGTVQVRVSDDGRGIASINIIGWDTPCGTVTQNSAVNPPVRISTFPIGGNSFQHTFFVGPADPPLLVILQGEFLANGTFQGSISVGSEFDPQCAEEQVFVGTLVPAPSPAPPSGGQQQEPTSGVPGVTRAPGLPDSGTGFLGGGASPFDWLVAGLIGAGIAWVIAGLAGARFAVAGAPTGNAPAAPRQRREDAFKPALRPASTSGGERAAWPQAAPKAARAAPKRPERDKPASWFAIARDELTGKVPEQFRPFRKRD